MDYIQVKDASPRWDTGAAVQLALDTKMVTEEGEFEGYAATYGNKDLGDDIILPGAFDESLNARPAKRVKMLWQHDTHKPIGVWKEMSSDDRGLYCRGRLLLETTGGRETHAFMKAGAIDSLSIGYRVGEYKIDGENGVRIIEKAELIEVSAVTFPMNPQARISAVKGRLPTKREFERFLTRDAGLTAQQAKAFVAEGYEAIQDARDAGTGGTGVAQDLQRLAETFRS